MTFNGLGDTVPYHLSFKALHPDSLQTVCFKGNGNIAPKVTELNVCEAAGIQRGADTVILSTVCNHTLSLALQSLLQSLTERDSEVVWEGYDYIMVVKSNHVLCLKLKHWAHFPNRLWHQL
jgi:hypothetical protein